MPALFVCALVLFAVAVLAAIYSVFAPQGTKGQVLGGSVGVLLLAIALTIGAAANSIPVRNVGIVTSFNKPTARSPAVA